MQRTRHEIHAQALLCPTPPRFDASRAFLRRQKAFDRIERTNVSFGIDGVGGIREHGGGDMEADCVHGDHGQDATEHFLFAHDEVEPRVKHDGLSGDHAIPTDGDDGDGQVDVTLEDQKFEEEAEGMQHTAIAGDQERPKVQASMPFEGEKDLNVQFDDIPPGDGGKCHNGHLLCRVEMGFVLGDAIWKAHSLGGGKCFYGAGRKNGCYRGEC